MTKELPIISPDKFHDECAVFGIYGHEEAANLTYLGLYSLQHRGQEASGPSKPQYSQRQFDKSIIRFDGVGNITILMRPIR